MSNESSLAHFFLNEYFTWDMNFVLLLFAGGGGQGNLGNNSSHLDHVFAHFTLDPRADNGHCKMMTVASVYLKLTFSFLIGVVQ